MKKLVCPGCGDEIEVRGETTTVHHRCPLRHNKPTWYENAPEAQTQTDS